MDKEPVQTDVDIFNAFASAVAEYKPWHTPQWNTRANKDPFWQIVDVAERLGFLSPSVAWDQFAVPSGEYEDWKNPHNLPTRKTRKQVWTYLKGCIREQRAAEPA